MIVSIHQPNFLPWQGFFHKIIKSDVFVLFDDVQFPRGKSFCSRVKIKTPTSELWLTVPVEGKSEMSKIYEVRLSGQKQWIRKHLKTLSANYKKAPYFDEVYSLLESVYILEWAYLADFNIALIKNICDYMGVKSKFIRSSQLKLSCYGGLNHILDILKNLGADFYLTGTGTGSERYIDEAEFENNGIKIIYQDFVQPQYPQLWGSFIPNLSIIDLLFNCGRNSLQILQS